MSKRYDLSASQLKAVANLCHQEQGSVKGAAAEASLMCNRFENFGRSYGSLYNYVRTCGWFAKAAYHMDNGSSSDELVAAVRDVICNGNRTLPDHIDEHDCLSDIESISTGRVYDRSAYVRGKTLIVNTYGARYTFWCFPDAGCDPFGYTGKIKAVEEVPKVTGKTKSEGAICWMEDTAADDRHHGYDQEDRWGEEGDYDCSSAVIMAWEQAGVPVKTRGATYTGNMKRVFTQCGFEDVTDEVNLRTGAGLRRSDVLLNEVNHTAMYCGNGLLVEAAINEYGGIVGGSTGDQTGREFWIHNYYNYPWDCVLRYHEDAQPVLEDLTIKLPVVRLGDNSKAAKLMQMILRGRGYKDQNGKALKRDGIVTDKTIYALKNFQHKFKLDADGICGPETWKKLTGM